jgi:glucuronosyltransferase
MFLPVLLVVCFSSIHLQKAESAKILMASPQFRSHVIVQRSVGESLTRGGHKVSIALASRYPVDDLDSFGDVDIIHFRYPADELYAVSDDMERFLADVVFERRSDPVAEPREMARLLHRECDLMMSDATFLERVRAERFDLVVVDPFIMAPCTLVLPAVLGLPFVTLTGFYFPWSVGLPALPSFFALPGPRPAPDLSASFLHRLGNTVGGYLAFRYAFFPMFDNTTLLRRRVPDVDNWDDLLIRSELFLMENDHWLDDPQPLFPNTIAVSGLTARPPRPLASPLAHVFNDADADVGVILVSFGSTANRIPLRFVRRMFDAFRRLKQTIVARIVLPPGFADGDLPRNVKLVKWLPQNDALGHVKTRLFVTHCGSHGQYEALYHGVPMVGLPMFAEQVWNCDRMRRRGIGLTVDDFFDDGGREDDNNTSSARLYDAIAEVLVNASYGDTVTRLSAAWRHAEPLIGSEKAAYWIDHVIKYGGEHLRPATVGMPLHQFLMIDIVVFVFISLAIVVVVFFCLIFCVLRWLGRRKQLQPVHLQQQNLNAVKKRN